ncbi:MAG: glycosyltransferase family 2 protein [Candidatus Micrarchaeaceae archaeon]
MKKTVSIVIPTLNAEKGIKDCINNIKKQNYKDIEIIVVDSFSKDNTTKIAKKCGVKVIQTKWKLFGARYLGVMAATGKIVIFIDVDQLFQRNNVIREIIEMMEKNDMLILDEASYKPSNFLEKLTSADRKLVHKLYNIHMNPIYGVLRPRAYNKTFLVNVLKGIEIEKLKDIVIYDDAIIYYEASKYSKKIGFVKNAIFQKEVSSIKELVIHTYKYGKTARRLSISKEYKNILNKKSTFRKGSFRYGNIWLSIQSDIFLLIKGFGFTLGYWINR